MAFIKKEDLKGATGKLIAVVLPWQAAIDALTSWNKQLESNTSRIQILLREEGERNVELVKAGKEVIGFFQEREKRLAALEEEKVELTCRLCAIGDAVSKKEGYYEYLLAK